MGDHQDHHTFFWNKLVCQSDEADFLHIFLLKFFSSVVKNKNKTKMKGGSISCGVIDIYNEAESLDVSHS